MATEPRYTFNNYTNMDTIDHWMSPHYVQAAFGLASSYLHNVIYFRFTSLITARKQDYMVTLYIFLLYIMRMFLNII